MKLFSAKPKRIYLDYAAATPLRPSVRKAMKPYFEAHFGNASATHEEGRIAREAIETARTSLARMLRIRARDVVFTSSGTESNNLAIQGLLRALHEEGKAYEDMEVITTAIEHSSILETLESLKEEGLVVRYAPVVEEEGRIDEAAFAALLNERTVLMTYAYANSEIGVIQDVKRISRIIKKFNAEHGTAIRSHLDASQAPLWLPCQMDMLGVDLMTLDAAKCYGPKGIGVLARFGKATLKPIMHGGGQEGGIRSGTESTALIVGAVHALLEAQNGRSVRTKRVMALRDACIRELKERIPKAVLNGSEKFRIANNINISLPGFDTEFAAVSLDAEGFAVATKSACGGRKGAGSYVVQEISDERRAIATLRITFGEETTKRELNKFVTSLQSHLASMNMYVGTGTEA